MPPVFSPIAQDTPRGFPGGTAAPLGCQALAEHFAVAHLGLRSSMGSHVGLNMALVEIIHDDVQCNEEGFEIEVQGILLERKKRADYGFSSKPSAFSSSTK